MVAGIALTIVVVLAAPRLLKGDAEDGFFRPRPNPDARPATSASGDADEPVVPDSAGAAPALGDAGAPAPETQYDFYTLLPGEEVALTDAQIAASARAEQARQRELARQQADPDAADLATPTTAAAPSAASTAATVTPTTTGSTVPGDDKRYLLQAGAFSAAGDAEALKARIALLGLSARVETAEINGRTMHRVRMGPYATAADLAEAKQKLGNGGLPALAIQAR